HSHVGEVLTTRALTSYLSTNCLSISRPDLYSVRHVRTERQRRSCDRSGNHLVGFTPQFSQTAQLLSAALKRLKYQFPCSFLIDYSNCHHETVQPSYDWRLKKMSRCRQAASARDEEGDASLMGYP
uniref:Uncharacterized protein n=1 Tax=Gasterosteus aculeatus TaxID=69293 RepID=G3NPL4_GASAC